MEDSSIWKAKMSITQILQTKGGFHSLFGDNFEFTNGDNRRLIEKEKSRAIWKKVLAYNTRVCI